MLSLIDKIMRGVDKISDGLFWIACIICLPALAGVITLDVFMRYVMNAPMVWSYEFSEVMLLIILFSSVPFTTKVNGNVRMDLLYMRFRGPMLRFANFLWGMCGLTFFGLLAYRAAQQVPLLYQQNRMKDFLELPEWPLTAFIVVCSCLLVVYCAHILFFGIRKPTGIKDNFGKVAEDKD